MMNNSSEYVKENKIETFEKCTKCAECCLSLTEDGIFTIPLTKKDAKRIKKNEVFRNLNKKKKVKIIKGTYDIFYPFDLYAEGPCPFLTTDTKKCTIYFDRPSNCIKFKCYD